MGVVTHQTGPKYLPDSVDLLAQLGTNSVRDEARWHVVEQQAGVYQVPADIDRYINDAAVRGLDPMLIFDYGNPLYDGGGRPTSPEGIAAFTGYAAFLAQHFAGKVSQYEVWNEWDIPIGVPGHGDPAAYTALLASVYPAVKAVDENITVIGGVVSTLSGGYLDALLNSGVLDHCDAFSAHTYIYANLPVEVRYPEPWRDVVIGLEDKLRSHNGGADVPLYVTETGWPTSIKEGIGITQDLQAAHIARLYLLARTMPFLRGVWVYNIHDNAFDHTTHGSNWGLMRPDLTPKESFHAFNAVSSLVKRGTFLERLPTPDPKVWALRFADADGANVWAVWNSYVDDEYSIVLRKSGGALTPLTIEPVGGKSITRRWGRRPWYDAAGATLVPNELDLTLRRAPILITGQLGDVTITRVIKRPFPESQR